MTVTSQTSTTLDESSGTIAMKLIPDWSFPYYGDEPEKYRDTTVYQWSIPWLISKYDGELETPYTAVEMDAEAAKQWAERCLKAITGDAYELTQWHPEDGGSWTALLRQAIYTVDIYMAPGHDEDLKAWSVEFDRRGEAERLIEQFDSGESVRIKFPGTQVERYLNSRWISQISISRMIPS